MCCGCRWAEESTLYELQSPSCWTDLCTDFYLVNGWNTEVKPSEVPSLGQERPLLVGHVYPPALGSNTRGQWAQFEHRLCCIGTKRWFVGQVREISPLPCLHLRPLMRGCSRSFAAGPPGAVTPPCSTCSGRAPRWLRSRPAWRCRPGLFRCWRFCGARVSWSYLQTVEDTGDVQDDKSRKKVETKSQITPGPGSVSMTRCWLRGGPGVAARPRPLFNLHGCSWPPYSHS